MSFPVQYLTNVSQVRSLLSTGSYDLSGESILFLAYSFLSLDRVATLSKGVVYNVTSAAFDWSLDVISRFEKVFYVSRFTEWFHNQLQGVLQGIVPVLGVTNVGDVLGLYNQLHVSPSVGVDLAVSRIGESTDDEYLELRYFMKG